jgi:Protein of unknown function (DUF3237)
MERRTHARGGSVDRRDFVIGSLGSAVAAASMSQATAQQPKIISSVAPPGAKIPTLQARYAFSVAVFFKERIKIDSNRGRAYVPAIGGEIWGPRLTGRVVPYGGADYGSGGLVAHYLFEASDGALIYITNYATIQRLGEDGKPEPYQPVPPTPIRAPGEPLDQTFSSGKPGQGTRQRFRTQPVFDAPVGKHDWLNRTVFVGHATRHVNPDHSIFTYYEVL